MTALHRLPLSDAQGNLRVVVEVSANSAAKFKFEPELEAFVFERRLPLGTTYPFDWGFFPSTLADDGDPLDALVWHKTASPQGSVILTKPLGLARVVQFSENGAGKGLRNDRLVVAPVTGDEPHELSPAEQEQLANFFVRAATGSGHQARVDGWADARAARDAVREAAERYEHPSAR